MKPGLEPSEALFQKATNPNRRKVGRTVQHLHYDRSSRGSQLPTGDGLRNNPRHVFFSLFIYMEASSVELMEDP